MDMALKDMVWWWDLVGQVDGQVDLLHSAFFPMQITLDIL